MIIVKKNIVKILLVLLCLCILSAAAYAASCPKCGGTVSSYDSYEYIYYDHAMYFDVYKITTVSCNDYDCDYIDFYDTFMYRVYP